MSPRSLTTRRPQAPVAKRGHSLPGAAACSVLVCWGLAGAVPRPRHCARAPSAATRRFCGSCGGDSRDRPLAAVQRVVCIFRWGSTGGSGNKAFSTALSALDEDMAQYVHDNTEDEFTHFTFLNAWKLRGAETGSISNSSHPAGQHGEPQAPYEPDGSGDWWTRYRSRHELRPRNSFAQAVPGLMHVRRSRAADADLKPTKHLKAIANTAWFHFVTDEQGGTELLALAQRLNDRGAARRAEHRADRGDALSGLERQGRGPPAAYHCNDRVPRPEQEAVRWAGLPDQFMPEPTKLQPQVPSRVDCPAHRGRMRWPSSS